MKRQHLIAKKLREIADSIDVLDDEQASGVEFEVIEHNTDSTGAASNQPVSLFSSDVSVCVKLPKGTH